MQSLRVVGESSKSRIFSLPSGLQQNHGLASRTVTTRVEQVVGAVKLLPPSSIGV